MREGGEENAREEEREKGRKRERESYVVGARVSGRFAGEPTV